MHATSSDFVKVLLSGVAMMVPYLTWLHSLNEAKALEDCGVNAKCIYFTLISGGGLPSRFRSFVVISGDNGTKDTEWLYSQHISPQCGSNSTEEMKDMCQRTDRSKLMNPMSSRMSTQVCWVTLTLWGASRIIHDWLLLAEFDFHTTMNVSLISTCCLFVCAVSSVAVGGNALELFFVQLGPDCGCFYRFGFLTAAGALATPLTLSVHVMNKMADTARACVGGDYLITTKFHASYRLFLARRLKPTGSMIGPVELGESGYYVAPPAAMLAEQFHVSPFLFFSNILALPLLLAVWTLAIPLFAMRAWQLSTDSVLVGTRVSFAVWAVAGLVCVWYICRYCMGYSVPGTASLVSLGAILDTDSRMNPATIENAFHECPEVAELTRIGIMSPNVLDSFAPVRENFVNAIRTVRGMPSNS